MPCYHYVHIIFRTHRISGKYRRVTLCRVS